MLDPDLPKNILDRTREAAHLLVNLMFPSLPPSQVSAPGPAPGSTPPTNTPPGTGKKGPPGGAVWQAPYYQSINGPPYRVVRCKAGYHLKNVTPVPYEGWVCELDGVNDSQGWDTGMILYGPIGTL